VRLRRLQDEFASDICLEWRSFLLRPQPDPSLTLERFRAYTRSWLRVGTEPDGGTFQVWATDAGPPSHSVPPHLVAKAATALGRGAFEDIHQRLLHAYFADNRDITDTSTLRAVWEEAGLRAAAFERRDDPALLDETVAQHHEALAFGMTGVPSLRVEGRSGFVMGAQPLELYRHWVRRLLATPND